MKHIQNHYTKQQQSQNYAADYWHEEIEVILTSDTVIQLQTGSTFQNKKKEGNIKYLNERRLIIKWT